MMRLFKRNNDANFPSFSWDSGVSSALSIIEEQPIIDAEPIRHGKWLWFDGVRCSQCNYKLETTGLPSYCPNCGARMSE